ncbi:MAG: uracil-DNA glycosylase [Candidatus Absconditabacterales bacterium]|nr:uracil-DNA glycosylase [Candidatus Absconditabacterales bacterium]
MLHPGLIQTRPTLVDRLMKDPRRPSFCQWRETLDHTKVYPHHDNLFAALLHTPLDQVSVVILGQDPYHQPGQAHGFAFSVPPGTTHPPSLRSIYRELLDCFGRDPTTRKSLNPCLTGRANQGVLLLNTSLSVQHGKPGSHSTQRWRITQTILTLINESRTNTIFLLWGDHAIMAGSCIDTTKHHVLTTSHPSPLAAHRGFLGSKHFIRVNEIRLHQGYEPIDRLGPLTNHLPLFTFPTSSCHK